MVKSMRFVVVNLEKFLPRKSKNEPESPPHAWGFAYSERGNVRGRKSILLATEVIFLSSKALIIQNSEEASFNVAEEVIAWNIKFSFFPLLFAQLMLLSCKYVLDS